MQNIFNCFIHERSFLFLVKFIFNNKVRKAKFCQSSLFHKVIILATKILNNILIFYIKWHGSALFCFLINSIIYHFFLIRHMHAHIFTVNFYQFATKRGSLGRFECKDAYMFRAMTVNLIRGLYVVLRWLTLAYFRLILIFTVAAILVVVLKPDYHIYILFKEWQERFRC